MSTHNICFVGERRKLIFNFTLLSKSRSFNARKMLNFCLEKKGYSGLPSLYPAMPDDFLSALLAYVFCSVYCKLYGPKLWAVPLAHNVCFHGKSPGLFWLRICCSQHISQMEKSVSQMKLTLAKVLAIGARRVFWLIWDTYRSKKSIY